VKRKVCLYKKLICLLAGVLFLQMMLQVPASAAESELLLTPEEQAYLSEHSQISVAVDASWIPYTYLDPDTGEVEGIVRTILDNVSQTLGLTVQYVPMSTYQEALQCVKDGDADLIAGVIQSDVMAENYNLQLTDPYVTIRYCAVTKTNLENLYTPDADYRIAVCSGSYAVFAFENKTPSNQFIQYPTIEDCIDAVETGDVDAAFVVAYSAEYFLNQPGYSDLVSALIEDIAWQLSFGVGAQYDPVLVSLINKGVSELPQPVVDQATYGNLLNAINESSDLETLIYRHPMETIFVFGILIMLIVLLGGIFLRNHRRSQDKNQKLTQELVVAERANAAKRDFLCRMSHDIRTPMNAILGLTELASRESQNTVVVEAYLGKMKSASQYLISLISDVLDMSQLESGKMVIKKEIVQFREIHDTVDALIRPLAAERQVEYIFDDHEITASYAKIDKMRLQQVIVNLLSNAVRFTPPGGKVECLLSNLECDGKRRRDRLIVRDNGIGISEEFFPKIFLPFEQENAIHDQYPSGTGLGLSIVKMLVEAMDGTISFNSQKGMGTEFVIELESECAQAGETVPEADGGGKAASFAGKRLLLCEDQPINAEIAVELLNRMQLQVEHVTNGELALKQFLNRPEYYYNAILMDIQLPVMNGLTAAEAIRALKRSDGRTIPIIALTANVLEEDIAECAAAGMNDCVSKPIHPSQIYAVLEKYL